MLTGRQMLSVLGSGVRGWWATESPPGRPQSASLTGPEPGIEGALMKGINKGQSCGGPGPASRAQVETTREEVTLRLNRKDKGPGERQVGQAAGPCAGLGAGAVPGGGSGSPLPLQY